MNRIEKKFSELRKKKKKALIVFMTAGDPSFKLNERLIPAFEKEGADLIEIGVPFSDPLADGPVIQASYQRSLARGTTLKKILGLVRKVRGKTNLPLLLMSSLNPLWHYGLKRFAADARAAGVDGVIIPDLPPDEGKEAAFLFQRQRVDLVYLLAPTSPAARQKEVARRSRGFVYYVSLTGVTGLRTTLAQGLGKQVRALKKVSRVPVCVGFGISKPAMGREVAAFADGIIVGSAVVRALHECRHLSAVQAARKIVRPFAKALEKKQGQ